MTELLEGGLSASSVQRTHGLLSQMLDLAVRDRRLPANPAKGVKLPRKLPKVRRFLTADQVEALVVECEPYGLVVRFLAYTGLRWGEMAALRVHDVDPVRRRMLIARSVTEDNGRLIFDTTKTGEERTVPLPRFLAEQITASFAGKGPDDLVFQGTRGGVLRNGNFNRRTFGPAAIAIGEPRLTPHGLRHTAASLVRGQGQRQGRSADAWARHGEHDTRPVRAPVPRPARRRRGPSGRHRPSGYGTFLRTICGLRAF